MRGYGRVEENLDEYENDELDEYEDTEGDVFEEEEEEEVEDPTPKREVHEYLELRQKLKEAARKKLAKQSGSGSNARDSKRSKLDNFGSFFGPSRPVIAERVIQESKSFLETRQEMPRASSSQKEIRKGPVSGTSAPKNGMTERRPHNPVKTKVENLKNTRDYSFLLSEDADVPRAANLPPARGAVSVQVPSKSKESGHAGRQLPNGTGERRPAAANSHIRPRPNSLQKPSPSIRSDSRRPERVAVPEHKKHYPVSGHGNGARRPALPKGAPSTKKESYPVKKVPSHLERNVAGASTERKAPPVSTLKKPTVALARVAAMANGQRPHVLKSQTNGRQQLEEMSIQGSKGKILPKQSSSSLKPQMKAPKQIPLRFSREEDPYRSRPQPQPQRLQLKPKLKPKPKPKPVRRNSGEDDEGGNPILEIRKMFGYDPNEYADDSDDESDMEADFRTIQMEERRSAKIAEEEDEIEWKNIQEEERQERVRQRRLAKRKMDQR